jgi:hypothetical protein
MDRSRCKENDATNTGKEVLCLAYMRKPTLWSLVVPKLAGIIEVWVHDSSLFGGLSILQHSQEQQVRKTTYLLARTRNYPAIRLSRSRVNLLQLSSTFPSSDFNFFTPPSMPSRICTYLACSGVHITVSIGWFRISHAPVPFWGYTMLC